MSQTRFIPEVANRQSFIVLDGRRRVYGGLPLEESATEYTEQLLVRLPESRQAVADRLPTVTCRRPLDAGNQYEMCF
jgi:hypothetical protein